MVRSNSAVITQNTYSALQVADIQIDLSYSEAIGLDVDGSNNQTMTDLESVVLDNMIHGVQANDISPNLIVNNVSLRTTEYLNTASTFNFGKHVLVNNSAIDTPDLAIITQFMTGEKTYSNFSSVIGTNLSGSISGSVVEDTSSNPYIIEDVSFVFTDNSISNKNKDDGSNWYVAFNSDNSDNYFLSKAINSELNALNDSSGAAYPIVVTEASTFNSTYALGSWPAGISSTAFNSYFTDSSGVGAGFLNVPDVIDFSGNNKETGSLGQMYTIQGQTSSSSALTTQQYGTFKITQLEDPAAIHVSSYKNDASTAIPTSQLPFMAKDGASVTDIYSSVSYSLFNNLYPAYGSDSSFNFKISTTDGAGGYYVADASNNNDANTSTVFDASGKNVFTLDSSDLSNNYVYTSQFLSAPHSLEITNGGLTITKDVADSSDNNIDSFLLSTGAEFLNNANADLSGTIQVIVQASNDRHARFSDTSDNGHLSSIFVAYNDFDVTYGTDTVNTASGFRSITSAMTRAATVAVTDRCILNGWRSSDMSDVSGGYKYAKVGATVFYDASAVLYPVRSEAILDNGFDVSGQFDATHAAYYVQVAGVQSLTLDTSGGNLWGLNSYDGAIDSSNSIAKDRDVSGNNIFFTPNVSLTNLDLRDLSYNQYRSLFQPKSLADLSNNGLSLSNGWSFVTGSSSQNSDGEIVFTPQTDDYLFTRYGNLSNIGTNAVGINSQTSNGLMLSNLTGDANVQFDLSISYGSSTDITGTDIITFTVNSPDLINLLGTGTSSTSFSMHSIQTDDVSGTDSDYFKAVIQCPIGNYTNLYMKTPWLQYSVSAHANTSSESLSVDSQKTSTLSFNRESTMSLWGSIQATTSKTASWKQNTSVNWIPISCPSPGSSPGPVSVAAYIDTPAPAGLHTCYIPNPTDTANYGIVTMKLKLTSNKNSRTTFQLSNVAYLAELNHMNATVFTANRFTSTLSGMGDIGNPFTATFSPVTSDLSTGGQALTVTIADDVSGNTTGPIRMTLYDAAYNLYFIIKMPSIVTTDMKIWYCPQDVHRATYNIDGVSNNALYLQNDNANNVLSIIDGSRINGVAITNNENTMPNDFVSFKLKGQIITVKMVGETTNVSGQELSAIGGSTFGTSTITRTVTFNKYRGYYSGSVTETPKNYTITRTRTKAQFLIVGVTTTTQFDIYNGLDTDLALPSIGSGSIGLRSTFSQSMLIGVGNTITKNINVVGDSVSVSGSVTDVDGGTRDLPGLPATTTLTSYTLYTFPGSGYSIVSGRVTAGGMSNTSVQTETYELAKSIQYVKIEHASTYSGAPSSASFSIVSDESLSNVDMLTGVSLTPDLKIYGPAGLRNQSINTPVTYLVIPPPFVSFTALSYDAVDRLPYRLNTVSNDSSKRSTVYMPITSDSNDSFTPFTGITAMRMNNMTFTKSAVRSMSAYTTDAGPYPLKVQGADVTVTEYGGRIGTGRIVYDGPVQDISAAIQDSTHALTYANINAPAAKYSIGYGQDLRTIGSGISNDSFIYFTINNAFMHDNRKLAINTGKRSKIAIYGYSAFADVSGNYAIKAHKYIDVMSRDGTDFPQRSLPNHSIVFTPEEHYTCDITFPIVDISSTPYTLDRILSQVDASNIMSRSWAKDTSYVLNSPFNFSFVALSTVGEEYLYDLFTVIDTNAGTSFVGHATFITMPDTFNVLSADGSPVLRITYNGAIITPMISTTQINLFNNNFTDQSSGINQEVLDFNVADLPSDISSNIIVG
jgi:hypothetical protein